MAALETTLNKITYTGDGILLAFSFPYLFYANADLKVYLKDTLTTAEPVLQTDITHYTVTGAGVAAGGTVTMKTEPTATEELIIEREVDNTQESEYKNYNRFPAPTVEKGLNRLTMMVQQLTEEVSRKIGYSINFESIGNIPDPIADTLIGFNSDASEIELKTIVSVGDIVLPATGLIAADGTTTPNGRTLSGVGSVVITNGNGLSGNPTVDVSELDTRVALLNINNVSYSCTSNTEVVIANGSIFKGVDSGNRFTFTSSRTFDISGTATELGALNTGAEASDTWYYLIALGDTTGVTAPHIIGVSAANYASFTTADLTGDYAVYDDYKRIGAIFNDSGSNLVQGYYHDNNFYIDAFDAGTSQSTSSTSYVDADYTKYVPAFGRVAQVVFSITGTGTPSIRMKGATDGSKLMVASTVSGAAGTVKVLLNSSQVLEYKTSAGTLFTYVASFEDDLTAEGQ